MLSFVIALGIYNFTRPSIKKDEPIEPRNEIMNRPDHFMMGNRYSPKFNKIMYAYFNMQSTILVAVAIVVLIITLISISNARKDPDLWIFWILCQLEKKKEVPAVKN